VCKIGLKPLSLHTWNKSDMIYYYTALAYILLLVDPKPQSQGDS